MKFTFDSDKKMVRMYGPATLGEMQKIAVGLAATYGGDSADIGFEFAPPPEVRIEVSHWPSPMHDYWCRPRQVWCGQPAPLLIVTDAPLGCSGPYSSATTT